MANNKQSFIFYTDWYEILQVLSYEQLGKLLMGILEYQRDGTIFDFGEDKNVKCFFDYLMIFFKKDKEKYDNICKRNVENGKKGGRPKKEKENNENPKKPNTKIINDSKKPKKADNDIDNDNDTDNDIVFKDNKTDSKNKYGKYGNVLLSKSDIENLKEKFPNDYQQRIENLSEGIELKGYKYKNHYLAILKWAKNDSFNVKNKPDLTDASRYEEDFVL